MVLLCLIKQRYKMEPIKIDVTDFKNYLDSHIITFQYTKKDGTIREAKGTRNSKYISDTCPFDLERDSIKLEKEPIDKLVELRYEDVNDYAMSNDMSLIYLDDEYYYFVLLKREKKFNPDVINYFDIDKKDWRSFRIDSYIGVIMMEKLEKDEELLCDLEDLNIN